MRLAGQGLCRLADLVESSFQINPKGESSMSDKIEKVPEKTRWEIAAKGLTGA
jgi:L-2-amino-thiazoline-4-carboxylic acid hydrolase-like protein